jgi:hypothetical protein
MTIYHSIDGQEFEKVTTITDTLKWRYEFPYNNKQFHKIVWKVEIHGNAELYDLIFSYD